MTLTVATFRGAGDQWDDFGSRQRGWTACHRFGWKQVFEGSLGHDCLYWGAYRPEGELAGILPLIRVKSMLFGHYLVSMPFLNYGGPLGSDDAIAALAAAAVDRTRGDGAKLLELRSRVPLAVDLPVSHRKLTVVLDLPATPELLLKAFPAKLRSQVRRPEKEGVETRFGPDPVGPFYQVFSRHMHALGTPAMPRRFFEALPAAFGPDVWFGCSYLGNQPVACGAGFVWGDEFEMTWASALAEFNRTAANMGLYFAFMQRAMAGGIRTFNFGRCSPDSGTHRFKRQWGSRDEQLHWYQYSSTGTAATPSPDAGPYAWGPRIWTRLPRIVVDRVGPPVARLIP